MLKFYQEKIVLKTERNQIENDFVMKIYQLNFTLRNYRYFMKGVDFIDNTSTNSKAYTGQIPKTTKKILSQAAKCENLKKDLDNARSYRDIQRQEVTNDYDRITHTFPIYKKTHFTSTNIYFKN